MLNKLFSVIFKFIYLSVTSVCEKSELEFPCLFIKPIGNYETVNSVYV